jgi:hypothetical protein
MPFPQWLQDLFGLEAAPANPPVVTPPSPPQPLPLPPTPGPVQQVPFNMAQLATWEDARRYAVILSAGPIVVGGGVCPETNDANTSGIYLPTWVGGPGGFAEPNYADPVTGTKYFFLHYRFLNKAEGMNVGLIIDKFGRYPMSPSYVLATLAAEAASMAPR